jgi:hypothetical protein
VGRIPGIEGDEPTASEADLGHVKESDMQWSIVLGVVMAVAFLAYECFLFRMAFCGCREVAERKTADCGCELQSLLEIHDPGCEEALIWKTQTAVLTRLQDAGARGVGVRELRILYGKFSCSFPELCDGCTFENWLRTLEDADVVVRYGEAVQITEKGTFILEFATEQVGCS